MFQLCGFYSIGDPLRPHHQWSLHCLIGLLNMGLLSSLQCVAGESTWFRAVHGHLLPPTVELESPIPFGGTFQLYRIGAWDYNMEK